MRIWVSNLWLVHVELKKSCWLLQMLWLCFGAAGTALESWHQAGDSSPAVCCCRYFNLLSSFLYETKFRLMWSSFVKFVLDEQI